MTTIAITEITTKQLHHARLAKAVKLDTILRAEYPGLLFVASLDEIGRVAGFLVTGVAGEGDIETLYEGKDVPELADLLEAAEDAGIDPELGADDADDEGEKASGSVVAETYRARYKSASTNGQSCGDWLAERLAIDTIGAEGFRVPDFAAVLANNHVDQTGAWARLPDSGQKGWVGRWRMNGRQLLEKIVALNAEYFDATGTKHAPDAGWLAVMTAKHEKWIAKQRKMEQEVRAE